MQRITIVGARPVGTSLGLALKRSNLEGIHIVGTSGDRSDLSTMSKMGAVDSTTRNLKNALAGADLVVFDSPLHELRELLEAIGPILDPGTVVTDTGATKIRVLDWAEEFIPRTASFIAGHPLIKETMDDLEESDPDVFRGVEYCIIPSPSAREEAVKTVVQMVEAVRAKPVFLDPYEHDSYVAAMNHLPLVMSSAFVTVTAGSRSWREMHRLAAADFSDYSRLAANDPQENEVACFANPEALVHWLDEVIKELYEYRNQIMDQSDQLLDRLIDAWEARARWLAGAVVDDSRRMAPVARQSFTSLFMGERLADRFGHLSPENTRREAWKYRGRRHGDEDEEDD